MRPMAAKDEKGWVMAAFSFLRGLFGSASGGAAGHAETLRRGALFRHVTQRGTVENARVLGVDADSFGIHHVSFALTFLYRDKNVEAGHRTLSAAGFLERYTPIDHDAAGAPKGQETREPPKGREEPKFR